MTRDEARELLSRVVSSSSADDVEVALGGGRLALTRFAASRIHQNADERGLSLSVRCRFGQRTARAVTNDLSENGWRQAVRDATEMARRSHDDDELLPVPAPVAYDDVTAWDAATAACTAEQRAVAVAEAVAMARAAGASLAGSLSVVAGRIGEWGEHGTVALMNSAGLFAWYEPTLAALTVTATHGDGSGWAGESWRLADLDVTALTRVALEKARLSVSPRAIEPGTYDVVLEPAAAAELTLTLAESFGAQDVEEGQSCVCGKLGQPLVGDNVALDDDFSHPLHRGAPFDDEGVARRRVRLIESGVAHELLFDRRCAARMGTVSTGHGAPVPAPEGPGPAHPVLSVSGPATGLEGLCARLGRGLLVTRFWYTSVVDERRAIFTGMTRDGLYWVEGGQIQHAVRDLRFNEEVPRVLARVEAAGPSVNAAGVVTPALLVRGFRFTA